MTVFRRVYGSGALHLVAHLAAFGLAGFALAQIVNGGAWVNFVAWFAGAAVLHDLVLLPLYSVVDRAGLSLHLRLPRARVPVVNHIRVPALLSGLLLLVYFPLILGPGGTDYAKATGHPLHGYLRNWLLISAALFVGSGVIYAVRWVRRA
jgi:hypothetical protein